MNVSRFAKISAALHGTGGFAPSVVYDVDGKPINVASSTYLTAYPRESDGKFAGRNAIAWYVSPLAHAVGNFVNFMTQRTPMRDLPHELYAAVADDADMRGNDIDTFWYGFMVEARARGTMLLLVDMPAVNPQSMGDQIRQRAVPYLMAIAPEMLKKWQIGNDGKFDWATLPMSYTFADGSQKTCDWTFDRVGWRVTVDGKVIDGGDHGLNECPLLIFSESPGDFPTFGAFSPIADIAVRLFNAQSELDEILRSQTFSLLTMQVTDSATDDQKLAAAKIAGQTIGTQNLLVHTGNTPAFIAPPDGPAQIYTELIKDLRAQADEIGLNIKAPQSRESGIALQMRYMRLNAALGSFARRMEDFEARAWSIVQQYLGLSVSPTVNWSDDFQLADIKVELEILGSMQLSGMPQEVIAKQQQRIVSLQFPSVAPDEMDELIQSINESALEVTPSDDTTA